MSLAETGASIGTSISPGIGTAVGGLIGGVADIFASKSGSTQRGAGGVGDIAPSRSNPYTDARFDSSGWVVSTSGSTARQEYRKMDSGMSPTDMPIGAGSYVGADPYRSINPQNEASQLSGSLNIPPLLIVGAIILIVIMRRPK